jgi:hypothetical protein
MGKAERKVSKWFMVVLSLLAYTIAGGLFIKGTFLSIPVLSWLPAVVHTVVGWAILLVGDILTLVKAFK